MIQDLLEQLCSNLDLTQAQEDKNNVFSLELREDVILNLLEDGTKIFIQTTLLPCPLAGREDLFIYLMKANLLGHGTGGSKIGLSEDEKFLTLSRVLPYEVNYIVFKEEIEDFTNYVLYWRKEINRLEKEKKANLY